MAKITTTEAIKVFGMLSDDTRLRIMVELTTKPCNVTSLCESLEQTQPTISHHLGLLRLSGLVVGERDGKQVVYRIADGFNKVTIGGLIVGK